MDRCNIISESLNVLVASDFGEKLQFIKALMNTMSLSEIKLLDNALNRAKRNAKTREAKENDEIKPKTEAEDRAKNLEKQSSDFTHVSKHFTF